MKHTMEKIKVGSEWTAIDTKFKVTKTEISETGDWVFYENTKTGQHYSCLAEAFLNRFTLDLTRT
jgi:hypothetical protein